MLSGHSSTSFSCVTVYQNFNFMHCNYFSGCDHILWWCCVLASFTNLYSQVPLHSVMWQIGNKYIQHLICSHFCFVRTQPIPWKGTCIIYEFGERWYLDFEGATNFFQSEFGGYQIKECWSINSTIVVRSSTWLYPTQHEDVLYLMSGPAQHTSAGAKNRIKGQWSYLEFP